MPIIRDKLIRPQDDQGASLVIVHLPDDASVGRTTDVVEQTENTFKQECAVEDYSATIGCRLRFHPAMMTSCTFILGLLPLVIAVGPSQLARRDGGTPVFGGMLTASFIGIFAIPALYV